MQQRERRAERRRKATRASDHYKSQAAGDPESGFCGHTEAHQAHQRAAVKGDGSQHESHPGKSNKYRKRKKKPDNYKFTVFLFIHRLTQSDSNTITKALVLQRIKPLM